MIDISDNYIVDKNSLIYQNVEKVFHLMKELNLKFWIDKHGELVVNFEDVDYEVSIDKYYCFPSDELTIYDYNEYEEFGPLTKEEFEQEQEILNDKKLIKTEFKNNEDLFYLIKALKHSTTKEQNYSILDILVQLEEGARHKFTSLLLNKVKFNGMILNDLKNKGDYDEFVLNKVHTLKIDPVI